MIKTPLLSGRSLLAVAMLVAGSIGGLYSCQKKPQEVPAPALAPSPVEAVRRAFNAAGHDRVLTQAFGDSAKLRWEPDWRAAYTRPGRDGIAYTYVPLAPTLLATSTGRLAGEFRMVGTQRFIVAKLVGNAYSFDLATYTVAKPASSGRHRTLAEAAAQPIAWATFSGAMSLQGLTTEKHAIFLYQNGAMVTQQKQSAAVHKTGARTTGSYECVTIYTCYWQAFCEHNGNPVTYGALTHSINGCGDAPGQEACGIWGMSWNNNGYSTAESCTYVDDPPVPDPSNPSGGNTSSPNTILNFSLQPCQTAVLNRLVNMSSMPVTDGGLLAFVVNQFGGDNTKYNWALQNGSLSPGTYGSTGPYDKQYHFVTTTFDASQWRNASDLSIARTMLHEAVHAYLLSYFADNYSLAKAEYPDLVEAYTSAGVANPNIPQHNFIAQDLLNDIAYALQQYGVSQGYSLPSQFYSDMAWGGLESSNSFKKLSQADRERISDVLRVEATGVDTQGNYQKQQGNNAGCL
jgi:hypothetical protein